MLCLVLGSGPGALTLSPYFQSPCVAGAPLASTGQSSCSSKRRVLRRRRAGSLGGNGRPAPQMLDAPMEASLFRAAEGDLESQGRQGLGLPIGPFSPTPNSAWDIRAPAAWAGPCPEQDPRLRPVSLVGCHGDVRPGVADVQGPERHAVVRESL